VAVRARLNTRCRYQGSASFCHGNGTWSVPVCLRSFHHSTNKSATLHDHPTLQVRHAMNRIRARVCAGIGVPHPRRQINGKCKWYGVHRVGVGVYLLNVAEIDLQAGTFYVDFVLTIFTELWSFPDYVSRGSRDTVILHTSLLRLHSRHLRLLHQQPRRFAPQTYVQLHLLQPHLLAPATNNWTICCSRLY
jgi:hypothetical protein